MITFIKAFCGVCYESPREGFALFKLMVGTMITVVFGCFVVGLVELYRWARGQL